MTGAGLSKGNVCISLLSRRKEKYWSSFHIHSTALALHLLSSSVQLAQICPGDNTSLSIIYLGWRYSVIFYILGELLQIPVMNYNFYQKKCKSVSLIFNSANKQHFQVFRQDYDQTFFISTRSSKKNTAPWNFLHLNLNDTTQY